MAEGAEGQNVELLSGFACLEGIKPPWPHPQPCSISPSTQENAETLIETEPEGAVNQDCIRQLSNSMNSHLWMIESWNNSTLGKSCVSKWT